MFIRVAPYHCTCNTSVRTSRLVGHAVFVTQSTLFGVLTAPSPSPPPQYECEDELANGTLLDTLGVGLGRAEMYAAMLAVKKLGEDTTRNVATVRFFGKFFGLYADYYVFETTLKDAPEIPEAAGEQGQGGGKQHVSKEGRGGGGGAKQRKEGSRLRDWVNCV